MKRLFITAISLCLLFIHSSALSQSPATSAPKPSPAPAQAPPQKLVQTYRDILAFLPPGYRSNKATTWTVIQRGEVNAALKAALVDTRTPARFRIKVTDVANWNGMTLFSEIPNQEGYNIRLFGGFTDDWKDRLATLTKGDSVTMEGILHGIEYGDLWNSFTLSISLDTTSFKK